MITMNETVSIAELLQNVFERDPWHGPSVKAVLQDITPAQALQKLPNSNSIIELVNHMTVWRKSVACHLEGKPFTVSEDLNFVSSTDWELAVRDLEKSQQALLDALESFPSKKLNQIIPGTNLRHTFYTVIHGVIHHDVYHLGQIVLTKKNCT